MSGHRSFYAAEGEGLPADDDLESISDEEERDDAHDHGDNQEAGPAGCYDDPITLDDPPSPAPIPLVGAITHVLAAQIPTGSFDAADETDTRPFPPPAAAGPSSHPASRTRRRAASTRSAPKATPSHTLAATPSSPSRPRRQASARTTHFSDGNEDDTPPPTPPTKKRKKPKPTQVPPTPSHEAENEDQEEVYATLEPHGLGPVTTPIDNKWIYLFFRFCAERHKMQVLREEHGVPRAELTEDETMKKEHIGNVYRDLDPGSRRMKENIIPNGEQTNEEICFRVLLFCAFYSESTWQALVDGLGGIPTWKDFNLDKCESILYEKSVVQKQVIYTSGFQLVPPTIYFGKNLPHFAASLRLVKALMECGLPDRLRQCRFAVDASHILQTAPTLGGFLSLNILCHLNDAPHTKFYMRNFATCGPGSRAFLRRMFGKSAINDVAMEQAGLKWLYDNQWRYWARLGEDPPHAWTVGIRPGMRVLDFENALCWAHRYVSAYQRKGYSSLADLPPPTFDPALTESTHMPHWCDEERHTRHTSKATLIGDYDEESQKLQQEEEGEGVYEVEKVVCRKGNRTDKDGLFRVRWKGYPPEEDSWERASSLVDGAEEAMKEWIDWEEAMWSTIARITAEHPYTRPFPGVKVEEGVDVKPDTEMYVTEGARRQRERRATARALRGGRRRVKSEIKGERA